MALAGEDIATVVQHGLYKRAEPADYNAATLHKVLDLGDTIAISKLGAIGREDAHRCWT